MSSVALLRVSTRATSFGLLCFLSSCCSHSRAAGRIERDGASDVFQNRKEVVFEPMGTVHFATSRRSKSSKHVATMRREVRALDGHVSSVQSTRQDIAIPAKVNTHHIVKEAARHLPGVNRTSHNSSSNSTNATGAGEKAAEERMRYRNLALVVLPVSVIWAILFEKYHWSWSEVDWTLTTEQADGQGGAELVDNSFRGLTTGLVARSLSLCKIYFNGAGRKKGRAYVAMLFCHNLLSKYLGLITFDFSRRMWNLYQEPSMPLFAALIMNWVVIYGVACLTAVYSNYTDAMMRIQWNDHMTRYFNRIWLPNCYVFRLMNDRKLDNPDQRIQEDIGSFVDGTWNLSLGLWNAITDCAIYGYMLIRISPTSFFGICDIPGWLFYFTFIYSAIGSLAMQLIGSNLTQFNWQTQRYGGDFRAELRRIFDQGETMAAVRSQETEFRRLQSRFEYVKLVAWKAMILQKQLNWWNHIYGPISGVLFSVILMPYFIKGEIDLGRIKQCQAALGIVSGSFNFFVSNYAGLAAYRAGVDRLYNFRAAALAGMQTRGLPMLPDLVCDLVKLDGWKLDSSAVKLGGTIPPLSWQLDMSKEKPALDFQARGKHQLSLLAANLMSTPVSSSADTLELRDAKVLLPSGSPVLHAVNLSVPAGQCVLISGKEGSGKSTLLRALAGIWPFVEPVGCRVCRSDGDSEPILIPQKPRLPSPISLAAAVCFPKMPNAFSKDQIKAALEKVKLAELANSGLDVPMDLNSILSGGEFQRLMIAHCLLAKPRWILLDESMAHLSAENQHSMYELLRRDLVEKWGTSLVSTSHDPSALAEFHDVHLTIERDASEAQEARPGILVPAQIQASATSSAAQSPQNAAMLPETEAMLRTTIARQAESIERLRQCVSAKKRFRASRQNRAL